MIVFQRVIVAACLLLAVYIVMEVASVGADDYIFKDSNVDVPGCVGNNNLTCNTGCGVGCPGSGFTFYYNPKQNITGGSLREKAGYVKNCTRDFTCVAQGSNSYIRCVGANNPSCEPGLAHEFCLYCKDHAGRVHLTPFPALESCPPGHD